MSDSAETKRVLSGIKPTGTPHIGNYLGMIKPAIELQENYETYYFVADYHALTTLHDPAKVREYTYDATATFLALGLDPERAVFFRDSDVPEVTELTWILNCVINMGLLQRAHAYKAAKDEGIENEISVGVFQYPVLMAADILIYDSHLVPVGSDQIQHIEMTRDMAQKFNHIYGETLVVPEARVREEVQTIPGIDGQKMSKSYGNTIEIFLPAKKLKKKIMKIETDSTPLADPKDPESCSVFSLYEIFASREEIEELAAKYRGGNYGYGHAKKELFEVVNDHLAPSREKYFELRNDVDYLEDVLRQGARKARAKAREVMGRVREKVGFGDYVTVK